MKKNRTIHISKKTLFYSICEYIVATCIILNCRSMWLTLDTNAKTFRYAIVVLLTLSVIGCCLSKRKSKKWNRMLILPFLVGYILVYLVATLHNSLELIVLIYTICLLYIYCKICLTEEIGEPSLFKRITNITTVICAISLFFWIFGSVLHLISPNGIVYTKWNGQETILAVRSYYGIHFEPQTLNNFWLWGRITRNTSIFAEAPMASVIFSLSFLMEILLNENPSYKKLIIIGVGTISTLSVIGIAVVTAATWVWYVKRKPRNTLINLIKWIIVPLLAIAVFYIGMTLVLERLGQRSGVVRIDDFIVGYKAWKASPFFGAGYENNEYIKSFMSSWRSVNNGFSNSPMQILANGGIYISLLYLYPLIMGMYYSFGSKKIENIAFYIAFLVIFTFDIISYQYIVIVLLLYFSDSRHKRWLKQKIHIKKYKFIPNEIKRGMQL